MLVVYAGNPVVDGQLSLRVPGENRFVPTEGPPVVLEIVSAELSNLEGSIVDLVYRSINEVISKRDEIAVEAKGRLQAELDQAETGIHIVTIEMKKTNVPPPVQPSFNEVNQAVQEKEQMIYQAREDYNKAIPAARGEAERTIRAAEGYALNRVNRAKGNADRFIALYNEYVNAKDITKRRLYLETIQETFPNLGQKYIVDADQKNLLPLLNLGQPLNLGQQSSGENEK